VSRGFVSVALVVALLVAGCSRQEAAWRSADSMGTAAAYEAYLEAYPAGSHAATARARLAELREEGEWSRARALDAPESYQRYLASYPEGRHAEKARSRLGDFLDIPVAAPPPAVDADIMVQLGAYGTGAAAAEEGWRQLLARHADLLGEVTHRVEPEPSGSASLWRLKVGPVSAERAAALCLALKARGESCLVLNE